ncbi:MAG: hypothetical protein WC849_00560 [Candidatus Paceibacterota bacterium]
MADYKKAPSVFTFLWFLLRALTADVVFVFLFLLLFRFVGIPEPILSIILVVIGMLFFIAYFILSCLWQQSKEIKKDDEEYKRNLQKAIN